MAAANTQTTRGSQTRLNWPWFRERAQFSTGSSFTFLRNRILIINPSTKMGGGGGYDKQNMISCLSVQHSHSYILLYNWSLRSTESYHGRIIQHLDSNLKELETIHRGGEGGHAYSNSVLAFFLFYPVISFWALVGMFKLTPKNCSTVTRHRHRSTVGGTSTRMTLPHRVYTEVFC